MAFWQARDFLFCGVCGTLLNFDSLRYASCPLCGFKRMAKDIEGKETRYAITAECVAQRNTDSAKLLAKKAASIINLNTTRGSYGLRMKG